MPRFRAQHEHGSDWSVVDTHNGNISRATGLSEDEAETAANEWNRTAEEFVKSS